MSKRPVSLPVPVAPLAKRPAYSEADELESHLQRAKQEAWDARQEAEELRIRASRESAESKLALLREQQRAEETALQRDYLSKSEQRLREQLDLQTKLAEQEREERQAESQQARERLDAVRAELSEEAQRERQAARERLAETHAALETELGARARLEAELAEAQHAAAGGGAPGAATGRAEAEAAREEAATLRHELEVVQRRLADVADAESLSYSMRAQLNDSEDGQAVARNLRIELDRVQREARAVETTRGELDELRRQLAAAERTGLRHVALLTEHEALQEKLRAWRLLFARELGTTVAAQAEAEAEAEAHGDGAAGVVAARLQQQRAEIESSVRDHAELRAAAREAAAQLAASRQAAEEAAAAERAATERREELERSVYELEARGGRLQAERDASHRWLETLEEDKARRDTRLPSTPGGGGAAAPAAAAAATAAAAAAAASPSRVATLEQQGRLGEVARVELEEVAAGHEAAARAARAAQRTAEQQAQQARRAEQTATERSVSLEALLGASQARRAQLEAQASLLEGGAVPVVGAASSSSSSHRPSHGCGDARLLVDDESLGGAPPPTAGHRVLHLATNPARGAQQSSLEALRARLSSLECELEASRLPGGGGGEAAGGGGAAQVALQAEVGELRARCSSLETQKQRLKTIFNDLISEFRKTVTLLTGFRVDMVGETRQYEVRPSLALKGDVLKFRCSKEGDMELLPTEFATRLAPQIETYLQEGHSIPLLHPLTTLLHPLTTCRRATPYPHSSPRSRSASSTREPSPLAANGKGEAECRASGRAAARVPRGGGRTVLL